MKKTALTLVALGAFALGACAQTEPATNENLAKMKEALAQEAAKTEAGYSLSGNISFSESVLDNNVEHKLIEVLVKNLDANLSWKVPAQVSSARDLSAYASMKYTELKVAAYDDETYEKSFELSTRNAEKHDAFAYLTQGNLYLDMSRLGIDSYYLDGETVDLEGGKMLIRDLMGDATLTVPGAEALTGDNADEMIYKKIFTFKKSGEAYEANASVDAAKLKDIYVAQEMADWYLNVRPTIDSALQDDAMVAARNTYQQQFDHMVPEFNLNLTFKYNNSGLTGASIRTNGSFIMELGEDLPETKLAFNVDLSLKVHGAQMPANFDTTGYTELEVA